MNIPEKDQALLRLFPQIELGKVGRLLSQGAHHRVYAYDSDWVVKVPRQNWRFLTSHREALEKDLSILREYCCEFLLETHVLHSPSHHKHLVLQRRIQPFVPLTPLSEDIVHEQFQRLKSINTTLAEKLGLSVDFLGAGGMMSGLLALVFPTRVPALSNLALTKDQGKWVMKILDTELLRPRPSSLDISELIRSLLDSGALVWNAVLLDHFFSWNPSPNRGPLSLFSITKIRAPLEVSFLGIVSLSHNLSLAMGSF